ncbi:MAG: Flp pilus assembly protein CpaB [Kiritimatiellae bacterium]|nr:Flp pilus assembly protein CpaB [Kiritimatiellia bacterium]
MKQKIIPIVSVLVGFLAFFLTKQFLDSERAELDKMKRDFYEATRQIPVVAAARDIPSGTRIEQGDLGKIKVPRRNVGDRAVMPEQVKMLYGKKVLFNIKATNPILWSDIEGGVTGGFGLASAIDHGMRAISLNIGGAQGISGMVQPKDRVDVLGTFTLPSADNPEELESVTLTVLQNVTVLATGQKLAKDAALTSNSRRKSSYSTVTLEVTPREAELLVFAEESKGRLSLALRNPGDVTYLPDLPDVNFQHLQTELPNLNKTRQMRLGGKATH